MNQFRFNTMYAHLYMNILVVGGGKAQAATGRGAVSYTHLTLPTKRIV